MCIFIYCNKCSFSTLQLHPTRVRTSILLVIAATVVTAGIALLGVLPLDAARPAATEGRLEAEVNVLLGVQTDDEGRDVDNLMENIRLKPMIKLLYLYLETSVGS